MRFLDALLAADPVPAEELATLFQAERKFHTIWNIQNFNSRSCF